MVGPDSNLNLNASDWGQNVVPLAFKQLAQPPCCIEFVPEKDPSDLARYFVVGTYDLREEDPELPQEDGCKETSTVTDLTADAESIVAVEPSAPEMKHQVWYGSLILCKLNVGQQPVRNILYVFYTMNSLNRLPPGSDYSNLSAREVIHTVDLPHAVLDLHFYNNTTTFAVVTGNGIISRYYVGQIDQLLFPTSTTSDRDPQYEIVLIDTRDDLFPRSTSLTSFCWDDTPNCEPQIVVTTDAGQVYHVQLSPHGPRDEKVTKIHEHTESAWCCSIFEEGKVIASGGDDSLLRIQNSLTQSDEAHRRTKESREDVDDSPKWCKYESIVIKGHKAGVTAILPLAYGPGNSPSYLITGSYDDHVRLWMRTSEDMEIGIDGSLRCIKSYDLGGGVFRLRLLGGHPLTISATGTPATLRFKVLASCMYNGAKLLEISGTQFSTAWTIKILAEINIHTSMVYACDAQMIPGSIQHLVPDEDGDLAPIIEEAPDAHRIFVSTSFYDHLLCVWKYEPAEGENIKPGLVDNLAK